MNEEERRKIRRGHQITDGVRYNQNIKTCEECDRNWFMRYQIFIGLDPNPPFPSLNPELTVALVWECPNCFSMWWFHYPIDEAQKVFESKEKGLP